MFIACCGWKEYEEVSDKICNLNVNFGMRFQIMA